MELYLLTLYWIKCTCIFHSERYNYFNYCLNTPSLFIEKYMFKGIPNLNASL